MTKNNIGVTMRYDSFYNKKEIRNGVDFNLISWIFKLGCIPHLIPNDLRYFKVLNKNKFTGFILSGGNDLNAKKTRTIIENKILNLSKNKDIPVLGICHGMQLMNKLEGGKIKKVKKHVGENHKLINIEKNYPFEVNSYHNFSISSLGKNFKVISRSYDEEIEAIKHNKYNWVGWMWHPERAKKFDRKLIQIAKKLFKVDT